MKSVPGLDLPGLDVAATTESYRVPGITVSGRDELHAALTDTLLLPGPRLVQVEVEPGMPLG